MIEGKTVLAIIPARGGSKGVPRKNIRSIADKPLIAWTIEEAKKSRYIDRLVLSSEDEEIINVAKRWGCEAPFIRPAELALDTTPGVEPVLHALRNLPKFDYIILLQPTSPLRRVEDIDGCLEKCLKKGAPACVSVTEVEKSPYWMFLLDNQDRMKSLLDSNEIIGRRQDLPKVYAPNGAIYVTRSNWLLEQKAFITNETLAYLMPRECSLDIDVEIDMLLADLILRNGN